MIKCPSCSHENVDGTTFCEMCGEELQAAPAVDANPPGATVTNGAIGVGSGGDIKCPACENLNPPDNVVCEVCGTELHPAGSAPVTVAPAATAPATTEPAPAATPATAVAHDTPVSAPIADTTAPTPTADNAAADTAPATDTASTPAVDASADTATPAPVDTATADTATADTAAPDTASTTAAPAAPLQPGHLKLVVEQGMNVGKQFVLGDPEMLVGREDDEEGIYPDIDLADQDEGYVHRKHATLKFENDQLFVTHLGGANKTRLNNKPIPDNEAQAVKLGDKLAFGKVVTRVMPHA